MTDAVQIAIVTLLALIAAGVLVRPYVRRAGKPPSASGHAPRPGCGTCEGAAPAPPRRS